MKRKLSWADICFLAPARQADAEGRGALYWGAKDIARARRLEKRGYVTVVETGEVLAGQKEILVTVTERGALPRAA